MFISILLATTFPLGAQDITTALERAIVDEMNLARTNPRQYAAYLRELLPTFFGDLIRRPGQPDLKTSEGPQALREAIAFLEKQDPLDSLAFSAGLSASARDHAQDQAGGALGHTGSDGSDMATRISRHGRWSGSAAENISYGPSTSRDVVIQLVVDDGVPNRGHRLAIFAARTRFAGAGCGPHARYGSVCVIDFAAAYEEGRSRR